MLTAIRIPKQATLYYDIRGHIFYLLPWQVTHAAQPLAAATSLNGDCLRLATVLASKRGDGNGTLQPSDVARGHG